MNAYATLTDYELAGKLNQLDKKAMAEVYVRYFLELYTHARSMIKNEEQAEDVVMDIFLKLADGHFKFEMSPSVSISAYLYTAIRRRIIDLHNRNKLMIGYLDVLKSQMQHGNNPADAKVRQKELEEAMDKAVENFSPKMRKVFELSRKNYYTHKQIAEMVGITEITVKSHISHGLKILRSIIAKHFFFSAMLLMLLINKIMK